MSTLYGRGGGISRWRCPPPVHVGSEEWIEEEACKTRSDTQLVFSSKPR